MSKLNTTTIIRKSSIINLASANRNIGICAFLDSNMELGPYCLVVTYWKSGQLPVARSQFGHPKLA